MNSSLNEINFDENFSKNYDLFSKRFPSLASIILENKAKSFAQDALSQIELKQAKNGEISALQNNLAFHSLYNPTREAETIAKSNECNSNTTTVFFSYGLAYSAIEFAKEQKEKTLIIIESDLPFAFLPFLTTDLSKLFAHKNLILLFGLKHDEIIGFFESQKITKFNIIQNKAQTFHNSLYFSQLSQLFERNKEKEKINENTQKRFGKLWKKNTLKNIFSKDFVGISELENIAKDLPICILAAGPSLQQILPHLKEIQKKCILVCVDTALRSVQKYGIALDFTVLMDSQYWNYRHLDFTKTDNTTLISEISVYPSVFEKKWKHIFLCDSQYEAGKAIQKNASYGKLSSGGSVATAAWDFARFLGSKTIFIAGLDLSYPTNQTHVKGATFETKASFESDRLNTTEKKSVSSIFSIDSTEAINYENEKIRTDSRMKMYAWWFESKLAQNPDVKTYNLSSKSLKIPGIDFLPVENILSLPNLSISVRQDLEKLEILAEKSDLNKKLSKIRLNNANTFLCSTDN